MKEKVKSNLVIEIENKIEDILEKENFKLVDIDITGGKEAHIAIYIYSSENNDLEKLGNINKLLYPILEDIPQFKNGFLLEVSSPGIFRELKYIKEIDIFREKPVKIISNEGEELVGISSGLLNGNIEILIDGEKRIMSLSNIKTIKLNG